LIPILFLICRICCEHILISIYIGISIIKNLRGPGRLLEFKEKMMYNGQFAEIKSFMQVHNTVINNVVIYINSIVIHIDISNINHRI